MSHYNANRAIFILSVLLGLLGVMFALAMGDISLLQERVRLYELQFSDAPTPSPNVLSVKPGFVYRTIGEMQAGEIGYTVPWAYDAERRHLLTSATISAERRGTLTLMVKCVRPGEYEIAFTESGS